MKPKKPYPYTLRKAKRAEAAKRLKNASREKRLDRSAKPWTEKQRRFVEAFCRHGIGWRAVLEAGFEVGGRINASKYATELRTMPHVAAYLDQWHLDRERRFTVSGDRIIEELAKIAFGGMQNMVRIQDDGSPVIDLAYAEEPELAAISEMTVDHYTDGIGDDARPVKSVKIKSYSKLQALEMLGKLAKFRLFANAAPVELGDVAELIAEARRRRRELSAANDPKLIEGHVVDHGSSYGDDQNSGPEPLPAVASSRQPAAARDIRPPDPKRDMRAARLREALAPSQK